MAGLWPFSKGENHSTGPPSSPNPESSFEDTSLNSLNKNISNIISFLDSPDVDDTTGDKEDLPATQPLHILKDVVAYVEVRSKNENRSHAVERELRRLGATIAPKFSAQVTHVIFRNGKRSTIVKAQKKGLHLVSVLWVDSCKKTEEHVPETAFQAALSEQEKGTPNLLMGRLKKAKSMQPKDFEEEVAKSAERDRKKRQKRAAIADKWNVLNSPASPLFTSSRTPVEKTDNSQYKFYVAETQPRSPDDESPPNLGKITIPETPPSMKETIMRIKAFREKLKDPNYIPRSDSEEEISTPPMSTEPLQRRLFDLHEKEERCGSSPLCTRLPSQNNSVVAKVTQPPEQSNNLSSADDESKKADSCITAEDTVQNGRKMKRQLSGKRKLLAIDSRPTEDLVVASKTSGAAQSKPKLFEPGEKRKRGRPALNSSTENDSSLEKPQRKSRRLSLQIPAETSQEVMPSGDPKGISQTKKGRRRSALPLNSHRAESSKLCSQSKPAESPRLDTSIDTPDQSTRVNLPSGGKDRACDVTGRHELEDSNASVGEGYSTAYSILTQPTNQTLLNLTKSRRSTLEFKPTQFRKPYATSRAPSSVQAATVSSVKSKMSNADKSKSAVHGNKVGKRPRSDSSDVSSGLESSKDEEQVRKKSPRPEQGLQRTLVTTSLHNDEQDTVRAVIKKFGGMDYAENVTSATSHLVCGGQRRTLNVLHAIAQGCWVVSLEWVLKSVEAGQFLPEEPYELGSMFPAAKACRKAKHEDEETYRSRLFADQGIIFVTEKSKPPQEELYSLISLCGGKITTTARKAHVCVGVHMKAITNCVTEHWVLDSITLNKVQPLHKYTMT